MLCVLYRFFCFKQNLKKCEFFLVLVLCCVVMKFFVLYCVFEVLFCVVLCYGAYCKKSDWWVPLGLGNELCTPPVTSPTIIHKIRQMHRNTKILRNTNNTKMIQGLVTKAKKEQEQLTLLKQRKDAQSAYERR